MKSTLSLVKALIMDILSRTRRSYRRTWSITHLKANSDTNKPHRSVWKGGALSFCSSHSSPQSTEQSSTVVMPLCCSSRKPQPVREWAVNLCLAEDSGADMADERDTKTSFVESKTSGSKVKCGIRAALLFTARLMWPAQKKPGGITVCAGAEIELWDVFSSRTSEHRHRANDPWKAIKRMAFINHNQ